MQKTAFTFFIFLIFNILNIYSINNNELLIVNTNSLNLHEEPNTKSNVITNLFFGRLLWVIEETKINQIINGVNSNWLKVSTADKKIGYVFGAELQKPELFDTPKLNTPAIEINNNEIEKKELSNIDFIKRKDNDLIINLLNGKIIIISNLVSDARIEIKERHHYFIKYLSNIKFILVLNNYSDSWNYNLINLNNGNKTIIYGSNIVISPDKKNILVFGDDMPGKVFQLFEIVNDQLELKYENNNYKLSSRKAKWINESLIEIKLVHYLKDKIFYSNGLLSYKNNKWGLEE